MTPFHERLKEIEERLASWEGEHYYDRSDGWISSDIPALLAVIRELVRQRDAAWSGCDDDDGNFKRQANDKLLAILGKGAGG